MPETSRSAVVGRGGKDYLFRRDAERIVSPAHEQRHGPEGLIGSSNCSALVRPTVRQIGGSVGDRQECDIQRRLAHGLHRCSKPRLAGLAPKG